MVVELDKYRGAPQVRCSSYSELYAEFDSLFCSDAWCKGAKALISSQFSKMAWLSIKLDT